MATAAPSPLASSTETTNGSKLRRLLVDGGTTVLRMVFDGIHPPAKLSASLHSYYSTLDELLVIGILSKQQRELLFPPDGSKPDSKKFDITLLFLLLVEICGLSPPCTGWNNKPHVKNKTLEANLVRIKLFRNELIHTPETRIDTRLFNELWKEISGVLVALGLGQTEIDRLKAEHCGEEDYLDILFKWADWEKNVKLMMKEVRQGQEKMCQTQQEQCALLQEIKQTISSLEEQKYKDMEKEILRNLAKAEFKGDIEYQVGRYQEGTREWVFNKVQNWLDDRNSQNRVMVISAYAGMGKSVIAAVICKRMQEAGRLSGSHLSA